MTMETSGEDDENEFFESVEDIFSASSSESSEEDGASCRHLHQLQPNVGKSGNGQIRSKLWYSGYEIWRTNPGTILERRQRLLNEMGLETQPEHGSENGDSLASSLGGSMRTLPNSTRDSIVVSSDSSSGAISNSREQEVISANLKDYRLGQTSKSKDVRLANWSKARYLSESAYSTLQQNCREDEPGRSVRSCTIPSIQPTESIAHERLMENNGAELRTGAGAPAFLISKSCSGERNSIGIRSKTDLVDPSSCSFMHGTPGCSLLSYFNNPDSIQAMHMNGASLGQIVSLDRVDSSKSFEVGHQDSQKIDKGRFFNAETTTEILCRIKNLDNGKEFVVNEVGKDGLWNKLRELDTGRELTLEEFESSLGFSPIVQEVMRRERAAEDNSEKESPVADTGSQKKKRGWLNLIKSVVRGSRKKRNRGAHGNCSDGRDGSSQRSSRRSGSATEDGQDTPPNTLKRIKVHSRKKSSKELTELHMRQEFHAHQGAIWTMKFSLDGYYLASAGQDCVVRVWEVLEQTVTTGASSDALEQLTFGSGNLASENNYAASQTMKEGVRNNKGYVDKKMTRASWPPKLFLLSEKPKCSFHGHAEDILDLSWSRSQLLLSSSMDKTVRLWHVSHKECLRIFKHHDYVTCIQFNPVDDGYFISGSLDDKVRIWSIEGQQVVDWVDLREMVTAACYTPNGQGAVVGSYKGTCRFYDTSGNKLQRTAHVDVQSRKKKKSRGKKITGFQFNPGDGCKVLITSSDSRIRVYDGAEIVCKYKGFRNEKTQISASFSPNGKYVICASEDSRVYIWTYPNINSSYTGHQRKEKAGSYEQFCSQNVLVAIPWPGMEAQPDVAPDKSGQNLQMQDSSQSSRDESNSLRRHTVNANNSPSSCHFLTSDAVASFHTGLQQEGPFMLSSPENKAACSVDMLMAGEMVDAVLPATWTDSSFLACNGRFSCYSGSEATLGLPESCFGEDLGRFMFLRSTPPQVGNHGFFSDSKGSATWPEEKLPLNVKASNGADGRSMIKDTTSVLVDEVGFKRNINATTSAWGLVIVTAGIGGEIRTFQNYGFPIRL